MTVESSPKITWVQTRILVTCQLSRRHCQPLFEDQCVHHLLGQTFVRGYTVFVLSQRLSPLLLATSSSLTVGRSPLSFAHSSRLQSCVREDHFDFFLKGEGRGKITMHHSIFSVLAEVVQVLR